jgi:nucleotide-binding universal stress UspA family protein
MRTKLERILVGVDGSENSKRALAWGVTLAERFQAEVVAVHAVGLLSRLGSGPPVPSHSHLEELHQVFESDWCASLSDCGVPHRLLCLDGPPVRVVLDAAEQEDVDLIVVGSRGVGGFAELQLGSTSHQVVEHTRRPVLVVPPPGPGSSGPPEQGRTIGGAETPL